MPTPAPIPASSQAKLFATVGDDVAARTIRELLGKNPSLPPGRIDDVVLTATGGTGRSMLTPAPAATVGTPTASVPGGQPPICVSSAECQPVHMAGVGAGAEMSTAAAAEEWAFPIPDAVCPAGAAIAATATAATSVLNPKSFLPMTGVRQLVGERRAFFGSALAIARVPARRV